MLASFIAGPGLVQAKDGKARSSGREAVEQTPALEAKTGRIVCGATFWFLLLGRREAAHKRVIHPLVTYTLQLATPFWQPPRPTTSNRMQAYDIEPK